MKTANYKNGKIFLKEERKEFKEHPSLPKKSIKQIVSDHLKKKKAK